MKKDSYIQRAASTKTHNRTAVCLAKHGLSYAQPRSAFALLTTLMLLTIAVIAMAGVARHSITHAMLAGEAQERLQRRWLVRSLQASLLSRTELILTAAEEQQHMPVAYLDTMIRVNDQTVRLLLFDEQAKLNVNTSLQRHRLSKTRATLRDLTHGPAVLIKPLTTTKRTSTHTDNPFQEDGRGNTRGSFRENFRKTFRGQGRANARASQRIRKEDIPAGENFRGGPGVGGLPEVGSFEQVFYLEGAVDGAGQVGGVIGGGVGG